MPVHPNHLKHPEINAEPEQLDLFGWRPAVESASSSECTLSTAVGFQLAAVASRCYGLSSEQNNYLRNLIVHRHCSAGPSLPSWYDYLLGVASTMSFLPTPLQETFWLSDRAALASDWACVQSDLNRVWHAVATAERECNEQRQRRREAQTAE
jgi:hypothetical protein